MTFLPILLILLVPLIIIVLIVIGVVSFFNNRNNNMDPNNMKPKASAKDIFLNLGAFIALYTLVGSLLGLLFSIIEAAYPKIVNSYYYGSSSSISWPVATLVVFFPIFILLMYFLEREYRSEPESQNSLAHRGLTYITLFLSALTIAGDLITVVYYFIDGQELTTGFLMKVVVLLVVASSLFIYFISDLRNKLTPKLRIMWRFISGAIIVGSIIWGFAVLGSPRTQRLYKYDEQKVNDLMNINQQVISYYQNHASIPESISELSGPNSYFTTPVDEQSGKPYEYVLIGQSAKAYNLCAEFNKASNDKSQPYMIQSYSNTSWKHPAGHYCFAEAISKDMYVKPVPVQ